MQTVYVPVQASNVNSLSAIPSGADTTSGYYLSYEVTTEEEGGGFTGMGWCLDVVGNPFTGSELTTEEYIINYYETNNSLNGIFSTWKDRVNEVQISDFCNEMMHSDFYKNGCIVMA